MTKQVKTSWQRSASKMCLCGCTSWIKKVGKGDVEKVTWKPTIVSPQGFLALKVFRLETGLDDFLNQYLHDATKL